VALLSVSLAVSIASAISQTPATGDWPQWRGPNRDGISTETGLAQQWPAKGPSVVWTAPGLGAGYGAVAIKGARVYVQGLRGRNTMVHSLNRADGTYVGQRSRRGREQRSDPDRGARPRSTAITSVLTEGTCAAPRGRHGVWHRNILRDFSGSNNQWLLSESPLVDGDRVIVTPGGRNAGIVALDRMTGKTIWTAKELNDDAGYASAVVVDVEGVRAYTTFMASEAVGVRASDGKVLWRYRPAANRTANIATPVVHDNKVFYSSNYGVGGGLVALQPANGGLVAKETYFTRDMQNHHGGVLLVNGTLYGFNGAILAALDFATGKLLWRDRSVGKGAITYADGRLYMLSEDNVVGLAEVTPKGYVEKGRFQIADQGLPSWSHPVVSGGRLYIRNQGQLTAYDVLAR
jgi:outer membrane protein assembly factor BamB